MKNAFYDRVGAIAAAAVGLTAGAIAGAGIEGSPGGRPNLVYILADDLGYGDLGCYGRKDIRTPNIDRLAREGVRFTQHYASAPECTPTRTALMTGRYPQRVGGLECALGTGNVGRYDDAIRLRETNDLGLPTDPMTLPRLLKQAGYATGLAGKWHLGYEAKFAPNRHGFDDAFYGLGGGMDYFHHTEPNGWHVLRFNGQAVKRDGYFTDLVTGEAAAFIERNRKEPFFLYVAYTAPHSPFQGPKDRRPNPLPEDDPAWDQGKAPPATYVAMIERMDEGVGRILQTLEEAQLAANTLVIFASDNGGTRSANNGPLSGFKGSTFEGGIRVPAIARWPGKIPAGTTSEQVCLTMDFTASMVRAAGAKLPPGQVFDGVDILRTIERQDPPQPRTLFWRLRRGERTRCAVRDGDLKYIVESAGDTRTEHLYDLANDPGEQTDLRAQRNGDLARLRARLAAWDLEVRPRR